MDDKKITDKEFLDETEKLKEELRQKLADLEPEDSDDGDYKEGYVENTDNTDTTESADEEDDFEEIIIESEEDAKKKQWKKKLFNILYDILIVVGIGLLLYGGYTFYQSYQDSKKAEESYRELENDFVVKNPVKEESTENSETESSTGTENVEPPKPKEWYEQIWVDLEGLKTQVNEDIIGWIFFENEDISYPILYSEDNAEYDRVRYDKVYSRGGSITLEANNTPDFSDVRNVIYGHNMKDESMFGKLKYYKQDKNYYEDHQYFQLLYDGTVYRYQIFSYFLIHESEVEYIKVDFNPKDPYEKFVKTMIKKSIRKTDIEVTGEDKTVTLLTCAPDSEYRFLVNALLVDQHVMPNADGTYPEEDTDTETGTEDTTESTTESEEPTESETPEEPKEPEYTYTEIGTTMWATTGVKVRNQPSTDGIRIGYLTKDMAVYVVAKCNENNWYRVYYGRTTGYVNGAYLTDQPPIILPDPSETTDPSETIDPSESETTEPEVPSESETTEPTESETPGTEGTDTEGTDTEGTEPTESETPGTQEPGTEEPSEPDTSTESETPSESEPTESESSTIAPTPSESESSPVEEPSEPDVSESEEPSEPESTSGTTETV